MIWQNNMFLLVKQIPIGSVSTYKILAQALGNAGKARAVGNALNKNRDFKNIPCHRLVRSNGEVGGYVFGADKKIKLLKKEGVEISNGKVADLEKYLHSW